jgi:hypothetical protein
VLTPPVVGRFADGGEQTWETNWIMDLTRRTD